MGKKYHDAEITIPSEQYPHAKQYAQQQVFFRESAP
ncbi:hypothetical protein J2Z37_005029 [Ammoniphilus resinae]|uniref:Uncharacterized protein n=1 Tax=Ammoniphilus resinae TaxID=861532 RepID=A0ABS4GXL2_9BACL|nr:hypothetical protein [Ammoniphilus resinae]